MANEKETRRGGEADLWDRFCDGLKEAGAVILRDQTPNSELVRAEGYRYLTRLLQLGLDTVLENADRERPDFFRISSPTKKQGACNPDQFYDQAPVDGAGTYRIRGSGSSCPMIEISVYSGVIGLDPTSRLVGFLNEEGLSMANDGSFDVVLSPNEHPGNWIKLEPDARIVMIRQYRLDWDRHRPAELSIDRLDSVAPPEPLTLARVDEALRLINEMVRNKAAFFARDSDQRGPSSVNTMAGRGAEIGGGMTMPGGVSFRSAYFKLERDQALLLDFTPSAAPYWGFQLTNYWFETMEYRYRPVSVNNYQAVPEPDGSMRVVVAGPGPRCAQLARHQRPHRGRGPVSLGPYSSTSARYRVHCGTHRNPGEENLTRQHRFAVVGSPLDHHQGAQCATPVGRVANGSKGCHDNYGQLKWRDG